VPNQQEVGEQAKCPIDKNSPAHDELNDMESRPPSDRHDPTLDPSSAEFGERGLQAGLRPSAFSEYIGQEQELSNLKVFVEASKVRGEALCHLLLSGPPGLGKTTLAHICAHELGVEMHVTSGPAIEKKGDLAGILTSLGPRDVLFIDEIHRLTAVVEENLYPAMEDFAFDIVVGEGPHARTLKLSLPPFTLIGATTRTGLLTSPLRDRFGHAIHLDFYSAEELATIVRRSARLLCIDIQADAAYEVARRSRGTPRIANRLLSRLRDFAQVARRKSIDLELARESLHRLGVDDVGFDRMDHRYLETLIDKFDGGPVGIDTLAASTGEHRNTLEDVYEPYLLQQGFIQRTPRGRTATRRAYEHIGRPPKASAMPLDGQGDLF
jgi:Holliday junction DNA helicase RuvB